MRAWVLALISAAFSAGCTQLWERFGEPNPSSCVTGGAVCPEGTTCSQSEGLCVAVRNSDGGTTRDGSAEEDLASDPSTVPDLRAVWGSSATDVWIVGDRGTVLRWDGTSLRTLTTPVQVGMRAVHGLTNGNRTLVGGEGGQVWEYLQNANSWSQVPTFFQGPVHAVALEGMKQWAAGEGGRCLERMSGSFVDRMCGVSGAVFGLTLEGPTVVAVGDGGAIRSWDGNGWSIEPAGTTAAIRAVSAIGNQLWAVGAPDANGWLLLRRSGANAWSRTAGPAQMPQMLYGVSVRSPNEIWAVGGERTILRSDGAMWTAFPCAITRSSGKSFFGVWADRTSGEAWAVGQSGMICRWDGSSWKDASL